jgi:hypothetical protein
MTPTLIVDIRLNDDGTFGSLSLAFHNKTGNTEPRSGREQTLCLPFTLSRN